MKRKTRPSVRIKSHVLVCFLSRVVNQYLTVIRSNREIAAFMSQRIYRFPIYIKRYPSTSRIMPSSSMLRSRKLRKIVVLREDCWVFCPYVLSCSGSKYLTPKIRSPKTIMKTKFDSFVPKYQLPFACHSPSIIYEHVVIHVSF